MTARSYPAPRAFSLAFLGIICLRVPDTLILPLATAATATLHLLRSHQTDLFHSRRLAL
jgi:hypothetical protein